MLKRWTAALAAVALLAVLAVGTQPVAAKTVHAASTSWLYNQSGSSVPMATCPNFVCTDRRFDNGTGVTMLCWIDMYYGSTGNYFSHRWFYVRYSNWFGSISRWVHSSYVYYQVWVPHC